MKPIDITSANFDQEIEKEILPVLADFWAPWCPPCKAMAPLLNELAKKYAGKIKVVKINTDAEPALAAKFKITALPTICGLLNGRVTEQEIGFDSKAKLEKLFERLLQQP